MTLPILSRSTDRACLRALASLAFAALARGPFAALASGPFAALAMGATAALAMGCAAEDGGGASGGDPLRLDTPAAAQAIDRGGALCETGLAERSVVAGQLAGYAFSGPLGGAVALRAACPGVRCALALFGPRRLDGVYGDGTPWVTTQASDNPSLDATLPATGSYFAVLHDVGAAGLVSISLTVNGAAGCPSELECDDGDPCTFDVLGPDGCTHVPDPSCAVACTSAADCDDGDPCTDTPCIVGDDGMPMCGVALKVCNDDDPCTANSCLAGVGCVHPPLALPECVASGCQDVEDCEDGNPCTLQDCVDGACVFSTAPECLPPTCEGPGDCDDGSLCTIGACVEGACQFTPTPCEDDDPCTLDGCSPALGCVFPPSGAPGCDAECSSAADCDDGDPCTLAACVDGGCLFGPSPDPACLPPEDCDDGDPCTVSVEHAGGCVHTAIPGCVATPCATASDCGTANLCVTHECTAAGLCKTTPVNCDDGNPCTVDTCGAQVGCVNATQPGPCDDGDPCTVNDTCIGGTCQPGPDQCGDADLVACALSGSAGTTLVCPLRVASTVATASELCVAMQMQLYYDHSAVSLVELTDNLCYQGVGCFDLPVAFAQGAQPLSTGHSVSVAPMALASWNTSGFGAMVVVNLANPNAALSTATVAPNGSISGDPVVMDLHFELKKTIGSGAAVGLRLHSVLCTKASSQNLKLDPLSPQLSVIVTSP